MTHPGDDGGLGPLLDGDSLRPGDRAAPDRRGVIGDGPCQPVGEVGVGGVEGQERHHRTEEVLDEENAFELASSRASPKEFASTGSGPAVQRRLSETDVPTTRE
jgi:hypothetical protein